MRKYLVLHLQKYIFLLVLFCCRLPSELPVQDAAPSSTSMSVPGILVQGTQTFRWTPTQDTEFISLCFVGEDISLPLSLFVIQIPTIILAVQTDGCIEPQDSALEDIVLRAGAAYELRVITDQPVEFVLTVWCN